MITLRLYDGYPHTSGNLQFTVRALQADLNSHGYQVSTDGLFGPRTEEAVERFQSAHNIAANGVAGQDTWAALQGRPAPEERFHDTAYAADDIGLRLHLRAAERHKGDIARAAATAGVSVAVLFGLGSRESGWGSGLRPVGPSGTGDFAGRSSVTKFRVGKLPPDGGGFGRGLLQIDYDAHEFARSGPWHDASANVAYGASVLLDCKRFVAAKLPGLRPDQALRAALAAYNCGPRNVARAVKDGRSLDYYTAHRNYSADTLERAGWFQRFGWSG